MRDKMYPMGLKGVNMSFFSIPELIALVISFCLSPIVGFIPTIVVLVGIIMIKQTKGTDWLTNVFFFYIRPAIRKRYQDIEYHNFFEKWINK